MPATGTANSARQLTTIATEADNALWSPDGKAIVFTSAVYPDCPALNAKSDSGEDGLTAGDKCNASRDQAQAASQVKARVFDHLLYRHWNAFTGDKRSHLFLLSLQPGTVRDLTPNDPHDVPPFSLGGGGGFAISPDSRELAFTENLDEEPAISTNADIFTLDLTNPSAKPVKISTSPGGDFSPSYSPDGKYLAWRSQARAGYESDKFRLMRSTTGRKGPRKIDPKFTNRLCSYFETLPASTDVFLSFLHIHLTKRKIYYHSSWLDDKARSHKSMRSISMEHRQLSSLLQQHAVSGAALMASW